MSGSPKAWNRAVLSLTGDRVALRLNGQLIYERSLEATNQRVFGLFHFADETDVRVRNVTYRGRWPRTLPPGLVDPDGRDEQSVRPVLGSSAGESTR